MVPPSGRAGSSASTRIGTEDDDEAQTPALRRAVAFSQVWSRWRSDRPILAWPTAHRAPSQLAGLESACPAAR
jgi:hypothetical protein